MSRAEACSENNFFVFFSNAVRQCLTYMNFWLRFSLSLVLFLSLLLAIKEKEMNSKHYVCSGDLEPAGNRFDTFILFFFVCLLLYLYEKDFYYNICIDFGYEFRFGL